MAAALALPYLLDRVADRRVMGVASGLLAGLTLAHGAWMGLFGPVAWGGFLGLWALTGLFYSAVLTPAGRLLRRSSHVADRTAVFTAQFALSHACWLITYPLAGYVATWGAMWASLTLMGAVAALATGLALLFWRSDAAVKHSHPELAADHPHVVAHGIGPHRHVIVIDDEHRVWPSQG